jgi:hypothetical protein
MNDDWPIGYLFLLGIILLIWFGGPWFNTAWYAVQYKVGLNQVHIDPMPKDCDWGHAPLGEQGMSLRAGRDDIQCVGKNGGSEITHY